MRKGGSDSDNRSRESSVRQDRLPFAPVPFVEGKSPFLRWLSGEARHIEISEPTLLKTSIWTAPKMIAENPPKNNHLTQKNSLDRCITKSVLNPLLVRGMGVWLLVALACLARYLFFILSPIIESKSANLPLSWRYATGGIGVPGSYLLASPPRCSWLDEWSERSEALSSMYKPRAILLNIFPPYGKHIPTIRKTHSIFCQNDPSDLSFRAYRVSLIQSITSLTTTTIPFSRRKTWVRIAREINYLKDVTLFLSLYARSTLRLSRRDSLKSKEQLFLNRLARLIDWGYRFIQFLGNMDWSCCGHLLYSHTQFFNEKENFVFCTTTLDLVYSYLFDEVVPISPSARTL